MSRTWDIAEAESVWSTRERITRPLAPSRRPIADLSSTARLAVMISMAAAAAVAISGPMAFDQFGGTSDVRVVLERSPIPVRRGPERERRPGVDFAKGRSSEQLASGFQALFQPSTSIDDSSDDAFVFR